MVKQSDVLSGIFLYQTDDGRTRIQCRFENDDLWQMQALIAGLFQVTVPTVNEHQAGIYVDGELTEDATIWQSRVVRREGSRQLVSAIEHYYLRAQRVPHVGR